MSYFLDVGLCIYSKYVVRSKKFFVVCLYLNQVITKLLKKFCVIRESVLKLPL